MENNNVVFGFECRVHDIIKIRFRASFSLEESGLGFFFCFVFSDYFGTRTLLDLTNAPYCNILQEAWELEERRWF